MQDGFLFKWLDMGQLEGLRLWSAQVAANCEHDQNWNEFWRRMNCLVVCEQHRRDTEIEELAADN